MNKKTPWMDVSRVWKRVSAVIVAVGVVATFICQVFKTPADITYTVAACIGAIALMISWYTDRQADYIYKDMEVCKNDMIKDIDSHREASKEIVSEIKSNIDKSVGITEETRKDTIRIQLIMYMQTQPENHDTIFKLAQKYFVKMKGDWFMTSEFKKWAKSQKVEIPDEIFAQINANTHEDEY